MNAARCNHGLVGEPLVRQHPRPLRNLPDLQFTLSEFGVTAACIGRDAFVIRKICCGETTSNLDVAMIPGTTITLDPITQPTTITVERTRNIDLLIPRTRARVHFGSVRLSHRHAEHLHRIHWSGLAPRVDHQETPQAIAAGKNMQAGGLNAQPQLTIPVPPKTNGSPAAP